MSGFLPVEIAVQDGAGVRIALEAGASRVELCQALGLGGLTPSAASIALAVEAADGVIPPRPSAWQSSTRDAPASSATRTPAPSWTAISTGRNPGTPSPYRACATSLTGVSAWRTIGATGCVTIRARTSSSTT